MTSDCRKKRINSYLKVALCHLGCILATHIGVINKLFQGTMSCLTFFYGTVVGLEVHLAVLALTALLGCACFFVAERELEKRTGTVRIAPC